MVLLYWITSGLSVLLCTIILWEFFHVHNKRVAMFKGMGKRDIAVIIKGRRRIALLYVVSTAFIVVLSGFLLFS